LSEGREPEKNRHDRYENYIRFLEMRDKAGESVFWETRLRGARYTGLLPFVQPGNGRARGVSEFKERTLILDKKHMLRMNEFVQRHLLTLNTVIQGIWAYLLYRYTANKNVVYGVTVSGRPEDIDEIEYRVGLYINILPLCATIDEDRVASEWFQELQ